jgi:BON domain
MKTLALILASAVLIASRSVQADEERRNYFGDPFMQVTSAIASCPKQTGPMITQAEMQAESHSRSERGISCYLAGRCRLPNAYMYDREIIPRVNKAILGDGRYAATSVYIEGQRRWVWLKGCVRTREQSRSLEQLVRHIDDVEAVINQLEIVGH